MRLPNSELQGMAWSEKIWISRKHLLNGRFYGGKMEEIIAHVQSKDIPFLDEFPGFIHVWAYERNNIPDPREWGSLTSGYMRIRFFIDVESETKRIFKIRN
jgi:hypothetical protein